MITCTPALNDTKVVEGMTLHFISVDATLEANLGDALQSGAAQAFEIRGLSLNTAAPELVVIQPFFQTVGGETASAIVATTVADVDRERIVFHAQSMVPQSAPLKLRFDVLVRE